MRAVSDSFLRALRGSHTIAVRATVCESFQTGTAPEGTPVEVSDGNLRFDASANIRGTADLVLPGSYWTDDPAGLVTPYGNEVYLERGLILNGGQRVYVGLGYFRIEAAEQDSVPFGEVRVDAKDRMKALIDARLEKPVQFLPNTSVQLVFETLVHEVYPNAVIEFDFDAASTLLPGSNVAEDDRYEFLQDACDALAKVMYWDYRGVLVVKSPPDPKRPVWTVNHGEGGVLSALSRERNRDKVFNAVVVNGESGGGYYAVARDANPASPTYYYGKFGKVPKFFTSPLITSQSGAVAAARSIMLRQLGLPYTVNFRSIANPAIEVHDPVLIEYSDKRPSQLHILDVISMPLGVEGTMTASTRDLSGVNIEVAL